MKMNNKGGVAAYIIWIGIGFFLGAMFVKNFLC